MSPLTNKTSNNNNNNYSNTNNNDQNIPQDHDYEQKLQDIFNRTGSFSSESLASRLSNKRKCCLKNNNNASSTLTREDRQNVIDTLARKLREQHSAPVGCNDQLKVNQNDLSSKLDIHKNNFNNNNHNSINYEDNYDDPISNRRNTFFHQYRFLVVMFGGLSVGFMMLLRYSITISMLKMVNQTHLYLEEHPNNTLDDMIAEGHIPGGEFNWNNEIQQMIMSWYMVAYTLPQMPMTKLGSMIGCRWAVSSALMICSLATLLTPMFAYWGWQYVIFLRLLNGFAAAPILPMMIALLESWLRESEISLGLGLAQALTTLFIAILPALTGYLSSFHWDVSFYVTGLMAVVFCFLWIVLVSDCPSNNPLVSKQELAYILDGQKHQCSKVSSISKNDKITKLEDNNSNNSEFVPDSWMDIFKVPSLYAYFVIHSLNCSAFNAFTFILPAYLVQFFRIKITENGLYCSLIQTGCIIAVIWPYPFLRLLQSKKYQFSDLVARRIVLALCCGIVAVTFIFVGTFHEFQLPLLFLNRCTQNGIDVIVTSTLMMNYARAGLSSVAFGAMNTVGNLSVVFSSTFIGWLMDYTGQSWAGWCMIFYGLGFVQIIIWVLFAAIIPVGPLKFKKKKNNNNNNIDEMAQQTQQLDLSPDSVPSGRLVRRMSVLAQ